MQKIVQVHCLPIDKPILEGKLLSLTSNNQIYYLDGQGTGIKMFLYFTSEEEIKEGDWYIDLDITDKDIQDVPQYHKFSKCITIQKASGIDKLINSGSPELDGRWHVEADAKTCRKIVATTNPELSYLKDTYDRNGQVEKMWADLPKIPLSFIKEYVEKQGNVKEVSLEQLRGSDGYYDKNEVWHWKILGLKLDPQGCVIISPIEEKIDWEKVFDNAQSMHLQEFINHYTEKVFKHQEGA